ncbi:MAG: hypothetical protein ACRDO0_06085, partial [Nocardioidaceae bacterium]
MTSPAATARRVEHAADPASLPPGALGVTDVHQHLWPPFLVESLRSRSAPPRLSGWTLETDVEPAVPVDPANHDPVRRRTADRGAGIDRCV